MTLDDIEKLIQAATPWPKPINHSGIALDFARDADAEFYENMRSLAPKMLAVCRAAKDLEMLNEDGDRYTPIWKRDELATAVAALEAE